MHMWVFRIVMMRMRSLMSQNLFICLLAREHLIKLLVQIVMMMVVVV